MRLAAKARRIELTIQIATRPYNKQHTEVHRPKHIEQFIMLHATELPEPSASALAVSSALSDCIRQAMAVTGHIGFDDYMHMALYEPGLGYYLAGAVKFGSEGDFVTAPELSPMFGRCIARQCRDILDNTGGRILEFGAGSGMLAAQVLVDLAAIGALPERYEIFELSPGLRERQRRTLAQRAPALCDRVEWLSQLPQLPLDGVIIANEILDALPLKCFKTVAGQIYERRVHSVDDHFSWLDVPADARLNEHVRRVLPSDIVNRASEYVSEINIGIKPWIADLARIMRNAVALIIDYGYPRSEYYHAQRSNGTLQCYFRHRKHNDPFRFPGLQDITASVDFTHVAEAVDYCDLQVLGFAEQASFLLATGLLDDAEQRSVAANDVDRLRIAQETKLLTLPTEMGASFKVFATGKGYNLPLRGFQRRDERHRL